MSHGLSLAVWLAAAVAFFALAVLGMFGLTREIYRFGNHRGWRDSLLIPVTLFGGLVSFMGGWLFYLAWWPFARLCRPFPRLRLVGPALGCVLAFIGVGALLQWIDPTVHPTWVNDTGRQVEISGCTDDPATFGIGDRSSGPFVSTRASSCAVWFIDESKASGCLYLPKHFGNDTVLRLSGYQPTSRPCP